MGSARSPTNPTLSSRPATYCWTRTSSNCSVIAATRALSALRSATTEPRSSPALASSAAGLMMAGSGKSSWILPWATVQRGIGRPAWVRIALAVALRRHAASVQALAPVTGTPANSSVATTCSSHSLRPWTPSQRLKARSAWRAAWNQLVVGQACGSGSLGEAGVHRRVGEDARQRVQLEDVRDAEPVHTHVHPAPVATPHGVEGIQGRPLHLPVQRRRDGGGTLEDRERLLGSVPYPLRLVPIDGRRPCWQGGEIEPHERQARGVGAVAEDRDGELRAREVGLDEHRLGITRQQTGSALGELRRRFAQVVREYTLGRALGHRLHEDGVRQRHLRHVLRALDAHERRRGDAAVGEQLFGAGFVQGEREGERVAPRVADVQILTDRRDQGLTVRSVEALGHVEDDVRTSEGELVGERRVRLEADDVADVFEGTRHGVDGGGLVPFSERIAGTGRLVGGAGVRFLIVGETDSHVVSGDLLQKRPRDCGLDTMTTLSRYTI